MTVDESIGAASRYLHAAAQSEPVDVNVPVARTYNTVPPPGPVSPSAHVPPVAHVSVAGVTEFDAADATDVPTEFVAVTLNV